MFIQNAQNRKSSMKLDVNSSQKNVISYSDKLPMKDEMGKKIKYDDDNKNVQGYYQFDVINNNDEGTYYEIYVDMADYSNLVHTNFIKLYLTDSDNNPIDGFGGKAVPTFYKLKNSSSSLTGKRLYRGYIKSKESKSFILRSWIGDAYSIDSYDKEVIFEVNVEVD